MNKLSAEQIAKLVPRLEADIREARKVFVESCSFGELDLIKDLDESVTAINQLTEQVVELKDGFIEHMKGTHEVEIAMQAKIDAYEEGLLECRLSSQHKCGFRVELKGEK